MKIKIKDTEYELKYTIRALFIFEKLTEKQFTLNTLTDQYVFFYSVLIANNPNSGLTFDDLIDYLDEHPEGLQIFQNFLHESFERQNEMITEVTDEKGKKKF